MPRNGRKAAYLYGRLGGVHGRQEEYNRCQKYRGTESSARPLLQGKINLMLAGKNHSWLVSRSCLMSLMSEAGAVNQAKLVSSSITKEREGEVSWSETRSGQTSFLFD